MNAHLWLAFAGETMLDDPAEMLGESRFGCWGNLPVDAGGTSRLMLGEPPGSPRPLPLVRFADKALRAFPTPLHAHKPTGVGR